MDFIEGSLLVTSIIDLFCFLILLLFSEKRFTPVNLAFFIASVAGWSGSLFLIFVDNNPIWFHWAFFFGSFMAATIVFFIFHFPKDKLDWPQDKFSFLLFLPALFFGFLSFVKDILFQNARVVQSSILSDHEGFLATSFRVYIYIYLLVFLYILLQKFWQSHGAERKRLSYIVVGFSIFAVLSVLFNVFLPHIGISDFNGFGPISSVIFIGFLIHAVLRYRFLNLNILLKRSLIYGITILLSLVVFSFIFPIFNDSFDGFLNRIFVILFLFIIWHFVPKLLQFFLDRWWFSYDINLTKIFSKIDEKVNTDSEVENRLTVLLAELRQKFHAQFVGVFLRDFKNDREYRFFDPSTVYFTQAQYMDVERISKHFSHAFILVDELPLKGKHDFYDTLKKSRVSVILKIAESETYEGVIILGDRKSSAVWKKDEIASLKSLHSKINISLGWVILHDLAIRQMKKMGYEIKKV